MAANCSIPCATDGVHPRVRIRPAGSGHFLVIANKEMREESRAEITGDGGR